MEIFKNYIMLCLADIIDFSCLEKLELIIPRNTELLKSFYYYGTATTTTNTNTTTTMKEYKQESPSPTHI